MTTKANKPVLWVLRRGHEFHHISRKSVCITLPTYHTVDPKQILHILNQYERKVARLTPVKEQP